MTLLRQITRLAPIDIVPGGQKFAWALALTDPIGRLIGRGRIITPLGDISVDWKNRNERAFSYFYYNILRYYMKSDLGKYIARVADRKDGTFVDVGANFGFYSIIARLHAMRAVPVEPESTHAAFLKRNEHVFGKVLDIALSDKSGSLPIYTSRSNSGASSLVESPRFEKSKDTVTVRSFSETAANGDFGPVDQIRLIKIDVEGHEAQTVRGLHDFLLAGHRPDIWCEVRGASGRAPNSYLEVSRFLEGHGYVTATPDGVRRFPETDDTLAQNIVFDLLFTSADHQGAEGR